MRIIDITQEIFHCSVYPGDPAPGFSIEKELARGDSCNLTSFCMCSHNGTHIDAPAHFIPGGKTVGMIPLEKFVGKCWVAECEGDLSADDARRMLKDAAENGAGERILIAGKATVTEDAAHVFAEKPLLLIGNESQTVGPESGPRTVHLILLSKEIVLLEGIRLAGVKQGCYFLNAAPINLGDLEGAPVRAWLLDEKN